MRAIGTPTAALAVLAGLLSAPPAPAYERSPADYEMVTKEVYVRMDDGVRLAAEIGFPSNDGENRAPGRFPAVLTMTPYGKDISGPSSYFVTRGYTHAVVDIRGAGASEGNLSDNYFSPREQRDGAQLVKYLGTRGWSNGRVGMFGGSYLGITQYMTALQRPRHLKAIVPSVAAGDLYREATYHGGSLAQFFGAQYLAVQGAPGLASGPGDPDNLPDAVKAKFDQAFSDPIAFDYLENTTDNRFYRERSAIHRARQIEVPVLIYDGWFDGFVRGATEMYEKLRRRPGVETRLWMDPVPHKGTQGPFNPFGYPASELADFRAATLEFLDRQLKRRDPPRRAPVKLFLMGRDKYLHGDRWPPKGVRYERLYLEPDGLSEDPPAEGEESYTNNPAAGVTNTFSRSGNLAGTPYFTFDQSIERELGLVWETEPLERRLAVVGPIALNIRASSTAPDTDWFVRVSDVAPDGSATLLTEGYLRASHRALDRARTRPERPYHTHTNPSPIPTNEFLPYRIEVWPTANEFRRGHRLRVQLASNDTPNHMPGAVRIVREEPLRAQLLPHQPALNTIRYGGPDSSLLIPVLRGG